MQYSDHQKPLLHQTEYDDSISSKQHSKNRPFWQDLFAWENKKFPFAAGGAPTLQQTSATDAQPSVWSRTKFTAHCWNHVEWEPAHAQPVHRRTKKKPSKTPQSPNRSASQ
jgi:hypothetical protein